MAMPYFHSGEQKCSLKYWSLRKNWHYRSPLISTFGITPVMLLVILINIDLNLLSYRFYLVANGFLDYLFQENVPLKSLYSATCSSNLILLYPHVHLWLRRSDISSRTIPTYFSNYSSLLAVLLATTIYTQLQSENKWKFQK
jgi:hypothetical protein